MSLIIKSYIVILIIVYTLLIASCDSSTNGGIQENNQANAAEQSTTDEPQTTDPYIAKIDKIYDSLLKEIISSKGLVRYDLLYKQQNKDKLNEIVKGYAKAKLNGSKNAQLAILCNAYNVHVLKQVIDRWSSNHKSVTDISGFFNENKFIVASIDMTLDDIENKFVRPKGDTRTHAALVCGAMGCPPLRNEPYTAEKLNDQLDSQCKAWINDKAKFKLNGQEIGISKIMKWYKEDFKLKPYENAVDFVRQFADKNAELGKFLASNTSNQLEIFYMDYDWNLNRAAKPK